MQLKVHRNGVWYAHYKGANGPVRLSLRTKSESEARKLIADGKLREIEHLALANSLTQEAITRAVAGKRVSCMQSLIEFKTWAASRGYKPNTVSQYTIQIGSFLRDFNLADRPVSALSFDTLNEWVNSDGSLSSRNGRQRAAKLFCSMLSGKGLVAGDPSALLKVRMDDLTHSQKETKSPEPFTHSEVSALLNLLPLEWAAMSALSLHTGFRLGDAASLEWGCFTPTPGIALWMRKVNRRIELPLPEEAGAIMSAVPKKHERLVFPEFAALARDPIARAQLSSRFIREAAKVGVTGKSFHSFRHTFATNLAKEGETIDTIRLRLGHSLPETTKIYVHVE